MYNIDQIKLGETYKIYYRSEFYIVVITGIARFGLSANFNFKVVKTLTGFSHLVSGENWPMGDWLINKWEDEYLPKTICGYCFKFCRQNCKFK